MDWRRRQQRTVPSKMTRASDHGAGRRLPWLRESWPATQCTWLSSERTCEHAGGCCCSLQHHQQAQLRRMEVWPWSLTLKAQLGLGHVELSEKYDRHYTRTCGGRVVTVGDLQRHAVGGVQLRLQSWDPMSPHPVQVGCALDAR